MSTRCGISTIRGFSLRHINSHSRISLSEECIVENKLLGIVLSQQSQVNAQNLIQTYTSLFKKKIGYLARTVLKNKSYWKYKIRHQILLDPICY